LLSWMAGLNPATNEGSGVWSYSAGALAFVNDGRGCAPAVSWLSISSIERPLVSIPKRNATPDRNYQNARNNIAGTMKSREALGLTKFDWPQISARPSGPITLPRLPRP
jgi:hypothetical protein